MLNVRPLLRKFAPTATAMIRLDHTHVMVTFHRYTSDAKPGVKKGLANMACIALEIHAQLEEEIFYPAVWAVADSEVVDKSVTEHNEMRRLISRLRSIAPTDTNYDETFMELMREVLHHVADEETVLLPQAEKLIPERLKKLGAEMTERRRQLTLPRTGEIAINKLRAVPMARMALYGAAAIGAYIAMRRTTRAQRD